MDVDETDSGAGLRWKNVARQLKEDLSSIVLLSEEDLQVSLRPSPQPLWPLPPPAVSESPYVLPCYFYYLVTFKYFLDGNRDSSFSNSLT